MEYYLKMGWNMNKLKLKLKLKKLHEVIHNLKLKTLDKEEKCLKTLQNYPTGWTPC